MLFFPYSVIARLNGIPFFTFVIACLCFLIFFLQVYSEKTHNWALENYCENEISPQAAPVFKEHGQSAELYCHVFFLSVENAATPQLGLDQFSEENALNETQKQVLLEEYARYQAIVPKSMTRELYFDPNSPKWYTYFTASLLHADILHLAFNLIFFFAFAIAAEQILGNFSFLLMAAVCSVFTKIAYQYGFLVPPGEVPTIGLSGFVTCTMAFVSIIYPNKWVSVFYLIVLFAGRIRIPLLIVASFYVGSDIYGIAFLKGESRINYVSHLSGAATGTAFAIVYLVIKATLKRIRPTSDPSD